MVSGGGGPEATVNAVSGQQGRATGSSAGDDHRPEPETSDEIRRHWEARNGTGTMGKAADTGRSELRIGGPGTRAPETGVGTGCSTTSAWASGLPQRPPFR